jgi:hypothetical protein
MLLNRLTPLAMPRAIAHFGGEVMRAWERRDV